MGNGTTRPRPADHRPPGAGGDDRHRGLGIGWNTTGTGIHAHGPMPGRILTVAFDGPSSDPEAPLTAGELRASVGTVSGVDVTVAKVHIATRFTDNARQASTYRKGRVLPGGDAAHVHSPFGGQGLHGPAGPARRGGHLGRRPAHRPGRAARGGPASPVRRAVPGPTDAGPCVRVDESPTRRPHHSFVDPGISLGEASANTV
ncbi:FAD-dependent monooxygenase [Embleya sp. NPDC050493]|uniref:FAD-dependent monooxygenase n=1 Tax=Embleya sp. NPDC050493 TaxID=3363989 RepID=UPI0037B2B967